MHAFRNLAALLALASTSCTDAVDAEVGDSPTPDGFREAGSRDATDERRDASGATRACTAKTGRSGDFSLVLDSGGIERDVSLHVPASYDSASPAPLVLSFHGVFSTAARHSDETRWREEADAEGFVVAMGSGVDGSWNAGLCCEPAQGRNVDDVGFARDLVARVIDEYCVDERRVFATGFSNGGAMAHRLACDASDLFAAVAPVGGSLAVAEADCSPTRPIPNLMVNGVDDPVVAYPLATSSFDIWQRINDCKGVPEASRPSPDTTCETFRDCKAGATTALCSAGLVEHQWPGSPDDTTGQLDATAHVWDFFAEHRLEDSPR